MWPVGQDRRITRSGNVNRPMQCGLESSRGKTLAWAEKNGPFPGTCKDTKNACRQCYDLTPTGSEVWDKTSAHIVWKQRSNGTRTQRELTAHWTHLWSLDLRNLFVEGFTGTHESRIPAVVPFRWRVLFPHSVMWMSPSLLLEPLPWVIPNYLVFPLWNPWLWNVCITAAETTLETCNAEQESGHTLPHKDNLLLTAKRHIPPRSKSLTTNHKENVILVALSFYQASQDDAPATNGSWCWKHAWVRQTWSRERKITRKQWKSVFLCCFVKTGRQVPSHHLRQQKLDYVAWDDHINVSLAFTKCAQRKWQVALWMIVRTFLLIQVSFADRVCVQNPVLIPGALRERNMVVERHSSHELFDQHLSPLRAAKHQEPPLEKQTPNMNFSQDVRGQGH